MSSMVRIPAATARSPHLRSADQNAVLHLLPQSAAGSRLAALEMPRHTIGTRSRLLPSCCFRRYDSLGDAGITHRADEPLPDRACAIRGGQSAPSHVGKYRAAPFRDDETVYDGERVVQAGHVTFLEQFRERCVGWRPNLCRPSAAIDLIKVT
jgi:hypothetical protein